MLILTRKQDQSFTIGPNITITVTAIRGDKVRIGITAPRDLVVLRDDAIHRSRQPGGNRRRRGNPPREKE